MLNASILPGISLLAHTRIPPTIFNGTYRPTHLLSPPVPNETIHDVLRCGGGGPSLGVASIVITFVLPAVAIDGRAWLVEAQRPVGFDGLPEIEVLDGVAGTA